MSAATQGGDAGSAASTPPRRRRGLVRRAVATLAALLLADLAGIAWFVLVLAPREAPAPARADGIVVLTGGRMRVAEGVALLAGGAGGRLLISGVHRDVVLAEILAQAGPIAPALRDRIELGYAAADTAGNAAEVAAWQARHRLGSLLLVTAGYHMPRARLELAARLPAGVRVLPHPVFPPGAEAGPPRSLDALARLAGEWHKLVGAALRIAAERLTDFGSARA